MKAKFYFFLILLCAFSALRLRAQIITTIAGTGTYGYNGDGIAATSAELNNPQNIAVDGSGNVYIADAGNDRVRKINTSGIISTVISDSTFVLGAPYGVALDASGNLYIADAIGSVLKVSTSGFVSALVPGGRMGSIPWASSVAVDGTGNVYVADPLDNLIIKLDISGVGGYSIFAGNLITIDPIDGVAATASGLYNPSGVAVDGSGNVYIADQFNSRIRKVDISGIISTVAGGGSYAGDGIAATASELNNPTGVAIDSSGNIYISDQYNQLIRKVNTTGIISTIAGNGIYGYNGDGIAATSSEVNEPVGVAVDRLGNIYVGDQENNRIRKISGAFPISSISSVCMGAFVALTDATNGGTWSSSNTANATVGSSTGIVIGIASGTAIITYNVFGSIATTLVTINPLPNAGTITATTPNVCSGSSITLTDTSSGGVWSSSNTSIATVSGGSVNGVSAGTLIISYTVINSCGSASATKIVTTNSLPMATSEQWTIKAAMPFALHASGAAVVDSFIYVIGGGNSDSIVHMVEAYNPYSDTWTSKAPMPTARAELGVAAVNGKIYAIGGYNGSSAINTVEEYDPSTNTWTTKSPMPTARSVLSVGVIGNNIYAVGGWPTDLSTLEVYNTATDTWTSKTPAPLGREQINGCAVTDGKLHFLGGHNAWMTSMYADNDVYDTLLNSWSSSVNLPFSRFGGAVIVLNNQIYYLGGADSSVYPQGYLPNYNTNFVFDTISNTWISHLPMINRRSGMTAVTFNNKIYVIGGYDSALNTVNWNHEYSISDTTPIIIASGVTSFCEGDSVILFANTDSSLSYQWERNGTNISGGTTSIDTPLLSGNYTLVITNSFGCSFTTSAISVTVNPLPNAGTITGPSTESTGSAITLSDTTTGGAWSSGNTGIATVGTGTGVVTGVAAGTAIISYTVINSCGSASATMAVNVTSGFGGSGGACGIITAIAGTGAGGYTGDGGPATAAEVSPFSVAIDGSGNLYICEEGQNCIRKVNYLGIISTIAGDGTPGYNGDGIAATLATLNNPEGISVDKYGNVFVADYSNNRIRKINNSGIISTVAGDGAGGYTIDGISATSAELYLPRGVTVDNFGNIYIGDNQNHRVRKVNTSGIISTIAGNGTLGYSGDGSAATSAALSYPCMISVDNANNVFFVDGGTNRVRKINSSGIISTIAGNDTTGFSGDGGIATAAELNSPSSVKVDSLGNIYIADQNNQRIRKINTSNIINTIAGNGTAGYNGDGIAATLAELDLPADVAVDASGNLFIADEGLVRKISFCPPSVSYIAGSSTVCLGSTTTLSDSTTGGAWSSSNTAIATIGSTGVVTGVAAGADTIFYIASGDTATTTITVSTGPYIAPITGTSTVCVGLTTPMSDSISGGEWFSSNEGVATVNSAGMVTGVSGGVAAIAYALYDACGISEVFNNITVVTPSSIVGTTTVCAGANTTLSDTTVGGLWSSSNAAIATVGTTGVVTGVSAGTATISYTLPCGSVTDVVTVNPAPNAGSISGVSSVCQGSNITLTDGITSGAWSAGNGHATVSGGVVTGVSAGVDTISYSVTNSCGTATVSAIITINPLPNSGSISGASGVCQGANITLTDTATGGAWSAGNSNATVSGGVVTGVSAGTDTISYSVTNGCGTATATRIVTINPLPNAGSISGASTVCSGVTIVLNDTIPGGSWSSASATIATVGSTGIVTGVSAGTDTISYSVTNGCGTAVASAIITVNPLANPGIISGASSVNIDSTITLTDTVSGGSWSAGNGNASISGGVVTGVSAGTDILSYTVTNGCGPQSATKTITVNPLLPPITGVTSVCVGSSIALSDDTAGGVWASSAPGIASVGSGTGIVTGISPGTAVITYTAGVNFATIIITVNPTPAPITGTTTLCSGSSTTLSDSTTGGIWISGNTSVATVGYLSGLVTLVSSGAANITYTLPSGCFSSVTVGTPVISGPGNICTAASYTFTSGMSGGTWSSGNVTIASVGSITGIVTGIAAGYTTTIRYTATSGCILTKTITVIASPGVITGATGLCVGVSYTYTDGTTGGTWASGNTSVATVGSASGSVTGVGAGTGMITYTVSNGCSAFKAFTVNVSPAAVSGVGNLCSGAAYTFTDGTAGGRWTSGNLTVATVGSSTGIVTGVATSGVTSISYALPDGCTATKTVTAMASPVAITGAATMCTGLSYTYTDGTSGGAWSSSNSSVATVGSTGSVTGITAGTAMITYTVSNGCAASKAFTVNPSPAPVSGVSSVCTGASYAFTDGTSGGRWSSSNVGIAGVGSSSGIVTGVSTGAVTISYILSDGCIGTKSVTGVASPTAISGPINLGSGSSHTYLASPSGGTWSSSNALIATVGSATGIVLGIATGTVTITYTVPSGCMSVLVVTIIPSTGRNDPNDTLIVPGAVNITIIPNPNKGLFIVKGSLGTVNDETVTLEVTNMLGQAVYKNSGQVSNGNINEQIQLSNSLANGMYILNIRTEEGNFVFHFVVEQ